MAGVGILGGMPGGRSGKPYPCGRMLVAKTLRVVIIVVAVIIPVVVIIVVIVIISVVVIIVVIVIIIVPLMWRWAQDRSSWA